MEPFVKRVTREGYAERPKKGSRVHIVFTAFYFDGSPNLEEQKLSKSDKNCFVDSGDAFVLPMELTVGTEATIDGLDKALLSMREGEKADVTIPPSHGYPNGCAFGFHGAGKAIPANKTLVFSSLHLVSVWSKAASKTYDDILTAKIPEQLKFCSELKAKGNAHFKRGRLDAAHVFYAKAVKVLELQLSLPAEGDRKTSDSSGRNTHRVELEKLAAIILVNISAVLMRVERWGTMEMAADRAVQIRPDNAKGLFRSAIA
eukprot:jgi/Bigna1/143762/aug1.81_g18470